MGKAQFEEHGTEHDRELQAHVCAYNMAFDELGLRFRWNAQTLVSLASIESEQARIVAYIETHQPHLLTAYSADFLSQAILARKNARQPGALPLRGAVAANANRPALASSASARNTYVSGELGEPTFAGA